MTRITNSLNATSNFPAHANSHAVVEQRFKSTDGGAFWREGSLMTVLLSYGESRILVIPRGGSLILEYVEGEQ